MIFLNFFYLVRTPNPNQNGEPQLQGVQSIISTLW